MQQWVSLGGSAGAIKGGKTYQCGLLGFALPQLTQGVIPRCAPDTIFALGLSAYFHDGWILDATSSVLGLLRKCGDMLISLRHVGSMKI